MTDPAASPGSPTEQLPARMTKLEARVTKLEAWVETVMKTLAGMQVEPVLCELEQAYKEEDE